MALADDLQFFAATDVGRKRVHNEDNFLVERELGLFVVADGMGGHAAGEVASAMAVQIVRDVLRGEPGLVRGDGGAGPRSEASIKQLLALLEQAVQGASAVIHGEAQRDPTKRGMGTTMSVLLLSGSHGFVAHVGDSRIYLVRGGKLHQVTEDHTVANELVRLGMITPDQLDAIPRKNAITRAVGVYERTTVDTFAVELMPRDTFLLASDGLTGYFDGADVDVPELLGQEDGDATVRGLIDFANARGGKDNITAVLVRIGSGDASDTARARHIALKREALAAMPLFAKLSERELLRVLHVTDVVELAAGELVVAEGQRGDELFVTLRGRLEVVRGPNVLGELGPGDHFGEMALVRKMPRSATVKALEPSELVRLKRGDFLEIIRSEPHIGIKLLWQFLGVLAQRLERTSRELSAARDELSAVDITEHAVAWSDSPETEDDPFSAPAASLIDAVRIVSAVAPVAGDTEHGAPAAGTLTARDPAVAGGAGPRGEGSRSAPTPRVPGLPSFADAPALAERLPREPHAQPASAAGSEPTTARRGATPLAAPAPETPPAPANVEPSSPLPFRDAGDLARKVEELAGKLDAVGGSTKQTRPSAKPGRQTLRSNVGGVHLPGGKRASTLPSATAMASARALAEASAGTAVRDDEQRTAERKAPDVVTPDPPGGETESAAVIARAKTLPYVDGGGAAIAGTTPGGFQPSKVTMPLAPDEELREQLRDLRKEYEERLRKARETGGGGPSDGGSEGAKG
jgi:serine/threonine protein phosphatase PrpC/CRP-like cAMP-binding protein